MLAPDNGVISARSATVGAVLPAGQELFRLIRQGRLEWRAEVASSELARLRPGMSVRVAPAGGAPVTGTLRQVAPTVDAQTRNALVYVDLPPSADARAGMFARGEFEIGNAAALTLPQSAVLLRDGFSYVLRVGADEGHAAQGATRPAQRRPHRDHRQAWRRDARVVAAGGGFLSDGDAVRVVDAAAPAAAASASPHRRRGRRS